MRIRNFNPLLRTFQRAHRFRHRRLLHGLDREQDEPEKDAKEANHEPRPQAEGSEHQPDGRGTEGGMPDGDSEAEDHHIRVLYSGHCP